MTRRAELVAALQQGDAGSLELLGRLAHLGWTKQLVKTRLNDAIRYGSVWVADAGKRGFGPDRGQRPRIYTADISRALPERPTRKPPPRKRGTGPLNRTPAGALVLCAISTRTPLELAWCSAVRMGNP